jgi:hypothetical protein
MIRSVVIGIHATARLPVFHRHFVRVSNRSFVHSRLLRGRPPSRHRQASLINCVGFNEGARRDFPVVYNDRVCTNKDA